ncbi:hypothetical protein SPAN111604_11535 [Sphingomonas antarctica]|uniref:type II secretion system protein N n=1 Tax=Sphingomonas antarctica TaxID=2040274 RepID=UPI0039E87BFB
MRVRSAEIAGGIVTALVALVALFPLALALPMFGLDDMITARRASGSVWSGTLDDARIGGMPAGRVAVRLNFFPLFVGRARIDLSNVEGVGAISAWPGGRGIDDVTASLPLAAIAGQIPVDRLVLEDATVHFSGTRCARADGRVRLAMRYPLGDAQVTPVLSGTLRCDGDAAMARLTDAGGTVALTLRLTSDGAYAGRLSGLGVSMRVGGRL